MTTAPRRWVLVPSPFCGPSTWWHVADELVAAGDAGAIPQLRDDRVATASAWHSNAQCVVEATAALRGGGPLILVAHSGAGYLLPAVGALLDRRVAAYVFVDAGLPLDGASRLELLAEELPEEAAELCSRLESGGRFPTWSDRNLRPLIPDPARRAAVLAEVRPRGLGFFTEPISVPERWPDAPVAYLRLSEGYEHSARQADERGWPVRRLDAGHFHLVVDPAAVATHLLALVAEIVEAPRPPRPRPRGRT